MQWAGNAPSHRESGQMLLAVVAGIASALAVVLGATMLFSDAWAASAWPMILAVISLLVGVVALLQWWRHRPDTHMNVHDPGSHRP